MPLRFGDAVVLVRKSPDGKISRVNAIVLRSALHPPLGPDQKPMMVGGKPLPAEEYIDVAFPDFSVVGGGHYLKANNMDLIFKPAYDQRRWAKGSFSGWQPSTPYVPHIPLPSQEHLAYIGARLGVPTAPAPQRQPPQFETKQYSDGSSATGIAPLPDLSPEQQDAEPVRLRPGYQRLP